MDTLWILLYSKFSPACKELFLLLQQYSLEKMFKLLDVDNKTIRQRILDDKKFSIKSVPCIVSVSSAGVASQYEGSKAFEVVKVMIQQVLPPPPPSPKLAPSQVSSKSQNNTTTSNKNNNTTELMTEKIDENAQKITMIEDLMDETDTEVTASRQSHNFNGIKREENHFPNHDRNVSSAIKGEKINVSSVMNQAQQSNDQNPPPSAQKQTQPPVPEEVVKKTVEKVNIASIMASSQRT